MSASAKNFLTQPEDRSKKIEISPFTPDYWPERAGNCHKQNRHAYRF